MGWNDQEDDGLSDEMQGALEYLDEGTPAYGIAMQVASKGLRSLSDKQLHIYKTEVVEASSKAEAAAEEAEYQRKLLADNT